MDGLYRIVAWSMFLLAVLSIIYGVIDYTLHPMVRGHVDMIASGLLLGIAQFSAFWIYRHDAQTDRLYDSELTTISEKIEQLEGLRAEAREKRRPRDAPTSGRQIS